MVPSRRDELLEEEFRIPEWMKMVMVFINRVGFPIMAFLLMAYMNFFTLSRMTEAIINSTIVMTQLKSMLGEINHAN